MTITYIYFFFFANIYQIGGGDIFSAVRARLGWGKISAPVSANGVQCNGNQVPSLLVLSFCQTLSWIFGKFLDNEPLQPFLGL